MRCDKITLAILHYTLRLYQDPERLAAELPLLATLTRPIDQLDGERATDRGRACERDSRRAIRSRATESRCQIGSGALPEETLPSVAVSITRSIPIAMSQSSRRGCANSKRR